MRKRFSWNDCSAVCMIVAGLVHRGPRPRRRKTGPVEGRDKITTQRCRRACRSGGFTGGDRRHTVDA